MDHRADLVRATRGDRVALRRVVDHWIDRIRRWAWVYCGEATIAEDAVQESLVRLLRFVDRYDPDRPFGPWLKTLVGNACRSELAKRSRTDTREIHDPSVDASSDGRLDHRLDLATAVDRVQVAFERLAPRQREILDLVDLQGVAPTEAARQLGLTPGAVRNQLCTARRLLRQELATDVLPLLRDA